MLSAEPIQDAEAAFPASVTPRRRRSGFIDISKPVRVWLCHIRGDLKKEVFV